MIARSEKSGFTLVEVTLALVVVALGLLGVFHLFPAGLRASIDATSETRCAQFVDEVFNQVYAEAAYYTNTTDFVNIFSGDVNINLSQNVQLNATTDQSVEYPHNSGEYIRYQSESDLTNGNRRASVELRVAYGRGGGFTNTFYTEVYNFGM